MGKERKQHDVAAARQIVVLFAMFHPTMYIHTNSDPYPPTPKTTNLTCLQLRLQALILQLPFFPRPKTFLILPRSTQCHCCLTMSVEEGAAQGRGPAVFSGLPKASDRSHSQNWHSRMQAGGHGKQRHFDIAALFQPPGEDAVDGRKPVSPERYKPFQTFLR